MVTVPPGMNRTRQVTGALLKKGLTATHPQYILLIRKISY